MFRTTCAIWVTPQSLMIRVGIMQKILRDGATVIRWLSLTDLDHFRYDVDVIKLTN